MKRSKLFISRPVSGRQHGLSSRVLPCQSDKALLPDLVVVALHGGMPVAPAVVRRCPVPPWMGHEPRGEDRASCGRDIG